MDFHNLECMRQRHLIITAQEGTELNLSEVTFYIVRKGTGQGMGVNLVRKLEVSRTLWAESKHKTSVFL